MRPVRLSATPVPGVVLVAAGAALWGCDTVLRHPLAGAMPAVAVVVAQYLCLAPYAAPTMYAARRRFAGLGLRGWLALLGIAWGSSGLGMALFTEALRHGNPTTPVLLLNAQPLVAVLLALVLLRERPPAAYWPCLAVAVFGAYLLCFGTLRPLWALGRDQLAAAGLAAGAVALWGSATVLARLLLGRLPFATLTAARYLLALPFMTGIALARGELGTALAGLAEHPLRLALMAAVPGLGGMLLYYRGLGRARAADATVAELAYPASAFVLNWLVLGATVAPGQLLGFVVLWLAIAALAWRPAARVAARAEPALAPA